MQISEQNKQWRKEVFLSYPNLITFVRLRLAQLKNSQPNLVC